MIRVSGLVYSTKGKSPSKIDQNFSHYAAENPNRRNEMFFFVFYPISDVMLSGIELRYSQGTFSLITATGHLLRLMLDSNDMLILHRIFYYSFDSSFGCDISS